MSGPYIIPLDLGDSTGDKSLVVLAEVRGGEGAWEAGGGIYWGGQEKDCGGYRAS